LPPVRYGIFIFLIDNLFPIFLVFFVAYGHAHGRIVVVERPQAVEEEILAIPLRDQNAFFVVGFPPAVGLAVNQTALARLHAGWIVIYFVIRQKSGILSLTERHSNKENQPKSPLFHHLYSEKLSYAVEFNNGDTGVYRTQNLDFVLQLGMNRIAGEGYRNTNILNLLCSSIVDVVLVADTFQ